MDGLTQGFGYFLILAIACGVGAAVSYMNRRRNGQAGSRGAADQVSQRTKRKPRPRKKR